MIAFHYPPFSGGSGVDRTLKFSRYLSEYGWQPIVLTVCPNAYPRKQQRDIPSDVLTARAFALDTQRHLSFRGGYFQWMAIPDRWISWWPSAVALGIALIRRHRPQVIWSTYPIATAHLIGLALNRWSRLPWIADFRDPMVQNDPETGEDYPPEPLVRRAFGWIENRTMKNSSRIVFTTPGTLSMYADRFPELPHHHWCVIPNGYDEEDFITAEKEAQKRSLPCKPIVLVHSGTLYPSERNPIPFFEVLSDLRREGKISPSAVRIILRGTGFDDNYRLVLRQLAIDDLVSLQPPISHHHALVEMLQAHGLLIFQAANCNKQIPAKTYESLRTGRPIFAMTDPAGDTAALLKRERIESIAPLDSKTAIACGLLNFLALVDNAHHPIRPRANGYSRKDRTRELAILLDSASSNASSSR